MQLYSWQLGLPFGIIKGNWPLIFSPCVSCAPVCVCVGMSGGSCKWISMKNFSMRNDVQSMMPLMPSRKVCPQYATLGIAYSGFHPKNIPGNSLVTTEQLSAVGSQVLNPSLYCRRLLRGLVSLLISCCSAVISGCQVVYGCKLSTSTKMVVDIA